MMFNVIMEKIKQEWGHNVCLYGRSVLNREIRDGLTGTWHFSKDMKEVRTQALWVTGGKMVQRTGIPHANAGRQIPI